MPQYAFFKGQIVPLGEAKVSIMTHALNYGTGCFEGIRAYWNAEREQLYVFQLQAHYKRFLQSCKTLMIKLPYSVDDLCDLTIELLRKEGYRDSTYIRPLAYKASEIIGVRLHGLQDEFAMFTTPLGKYVENDEGAKVGTSSWRRIDDNMIPARAKITGAYINSAFIKTEAELNGYDEAIVLTHDGHVSEGSAENIWIIKDGKAVTPPVTDNILEGITRNVVKTLLTQELGLEVVERPIDRTELYNLEEMFFCGTGVEVVAIAEVDRRPVGNGKLGPITKRMRDLYATVVRGGMPKYMHWCTPVYAEQGAVMPKLERAQVNV
jgi:branched-chain amino acid aminotransferase